MLFFSRYKITTQNRNMFEKEKVLRMSTVMATQRGWYNLCPLCFSHFSECIRAYRPKYVVLRLFFFLDIMKYPLFKVKKTRGMQITVSMLLELLIHRETVNKCFIMFLSTAQLQLLCPHETVQL